MNEDYTQAIERLVKEGYIILQIDISETKSKYYNIWKWQEGYFSSAQSVEFNTFTGINITDFLKKNSQQYNNSVNFIANFESYNSNGLVIHCEFSKKIPWIKYELAK